MLQEDPNLSRPDRPQTPQEAALERLSQLRPQLNAPPAAWPPALKTQLEALLAALAAADPAGPGRLADDLLDKNGCAPYSLAALRQYLALAAAEAPETDPNP